MKKIGIITFHASYNCGSILQCVALKEIVSNKGNDVEIINFSNKNQQGLYSVFYKKKTLKNIVKNILCIQGYNIIKNHYVQYKEYINKQLEIKGKLYETSDELKAYSNKFDVLIAGGDQVWNVNCDDFDTAYFLDFASKPTKISYSPSLGATNINLSPKKDLYKKLLLDFDDISCREDNGKKWLEELTGRNVELLLDPTMLLTKEEWIKHLQPTKLDINRDFIFYYAFSYSEENNIAIEAIANELNIPVMIIDSKQWYIKGLYRYKHFVLCEETGPNAFLHLMLKSKYVITTSFHGTAFSVIFNKQFLYINSRGHEKTDDRTSCLVEKLNLRDRFVYVEDVNLNKINEVIDYSQVNISVDGLKELAFGYLDRNLK